VVLRTSFPFAPALTQDIVSTRHTPGFRICNATSDDAAAIADLGAHVFIVTFGRFVAPRELCAYLEQSYSYKERLKDIVEPDKDMIVVTDSADHMIAFAFLSRGTTEPCIAHIPDQVELQ